MKKLSTKWISYFFYIFSGYMMLYLLAIRTVALSMTHLFSSRHLAAGLTGLCVTSMALASGYVVHPEEVGYWASWLKYATPQWWLEHPIVQNELNSTKTFECSGNPVVTNNKILQQLPCGLPTGEVAVQYFEFDTYPFSAPYASESVWFSPAIVPVLITVLFFGLFQLLDIVFFMFLRQVSKQSRSKKYKM